MRQSGILPAELPDLSAGQSLPSQPVERPMVLLFTQTSLAIAVRRDGYLSRQP